MHQRSSECFDAMINFYHKFGFTLLIAALIISILGMLGVYGDTGVDRTMVVLWSSFMIIGFLVTLVGILMQIRS